MLSTLKTYFNSIVIGVFVVLTISCIWLYKTSEARKEKIISLERDVSEKQLVIESLSKEISKRIEDIESLNATYRNIETAHKQKISTLLDTINENEKNLKALEEKVNKELNDTILGISKTTGYAQK